MNAIEKEIKCIVWDLDNTIWEGILPESDSVGLKPGIREVIQSLDARGILHSVASRNNYADAWGKLQEFGLDEYFLYPEINWNAKSASIGNIRKNLNIGFDSMLFIDDERFERDEVQNVCCEVTCIDASAYQDLLHHPRLNPKFITEDSKKRRLMYIQDMVRNEQENTFVGPHEKFLASLNMKFIISEAKTEDLKRAEELTIRSNQLNATGCVYDYDELNAFIQSDQHKLWICELTDNYGSYGKIGLALVETDENYWHLKLLLMSCRVISRGVGTVMLTYIMQLAKKNEKKLLADFKRTDRNKMMYITYKFANFKEKSSGADGYIIFENDLSVIQQFPKYIEVHY